MPPPSQPGLLLLLLLLPYQPAQRAAWTASCSAQRKCSLMMHNACLACTCAVGHFCCAFPPLSSSLLAIASVAHMARLYPGLLAGCL